MTDTEEVEIHSVCDDESSSEDCDCEDCTSFRQALGQHDNDEEEDDEEDEEEEEDDEEEDDDDEDIIRMKWIADGSKTLDDVIEKLREQIKFIEGLKEAGWELVREMDDDYGFIKQKLQT